jgi:hypothetical protein
MVSETNTKLVREIDKLNENEILAVTEYVSQLLSSRFPIPTSNSAENQLGDDLIATLSAERENVRARQVVEWERIRRRSLAKAA